MCFWGSSRKFLRFLSPPKRHRNRQEQSKVHHRSSATSEQERTADFILHRCKTQTLHAAIYHLHHCQNRLDQIHVNKANLKRQNWKMDLGLDRICFQIRSPKVVKGQSVAAFPSRPSGGGN
ncbi:unnamed protein product [Prunus brigantina]